ncbi:hypothetical protein J4727_18260 [Providencia rettgeri]|uniref:Uncharacterized protein n=1 Tax=Providencia rettgeri TaxID=587 RepID=A0A939NBI1_PRORE|nr:hypothetical protein [Providencia rettgeri]
MNKQAQPIGLVCAIPFTSSGYSTEYRRADIEEKQLHYKALFMIITKPATNSH